MRSSNSVNRKKYLCGGPSISEKNTTFFFMDIRFKLSIPSGNVFSIFKDLISDALQSGQNSFNSSKVQSKDTNSSTLLPLLRFSLHLFILCTKCARKIWLISRGSNCTKNCTFCQSQRTKNVTNDPPRVSEFSVCR
jgi:hypothetical protein